MSEICTAENRDKIFLRLAIFVVMGLYFFVNFHRSVIPGSIFSTLQTEFDTSGAWITALGSAFMYVYAGAQLFVGSWVDRSGGIRVILTGGIVFCLGAVLLPFGTSLWWIYICRAMLGIGCGCIYLSMVAEIRRAYPELLPIFLGVALLVGYSGSMTANAPFVYLSEVFGWRKVLAVCGFIALGLYLIFALLSCKIKLPPKRQEHFSFKPFIQALKIPCNRYLFLGVAIAFASFMVLASFCGKKFLEDFCGMETVDAGVVLTVMGGCSAGASLFSPILYRLSGNRLKPFIHFIGFGTFIPMLVIVLAICCGYTAWWLVAAMFFIITIACNLSPVYVNIISQYNPDSFGVALSLSNFLAYAFIAIFGSAAGFILDVFPPTVIDGVKIYGENSYLLFFGCFALLNIFSIYCFAKTCSFLKK